MGRRTRCRRPPPALVAHRLVAAGDGPELHRVCRGRRRGVSLGTGHAERLILVAASPRRTAARAISEDDRRRRAPALRHRQRTHPQRRLRIRERQCGGHRLLPPRFCDDCDGVSHPLRRCLRRQHRAGGAARRRRDRAPRRAAAHRAARLGAKIACARAQWLSDGRLPQLVVCAADVCRQLHDFQGRRHDRHRGLRAAEPRHGRAADGARAALRREHVPRHPHDRAAADAVRRARDATRRAPCHRQRPRAGGRGGRAERGQQRADARPHASGRAARGRARDAAEPPPRRRVLSVRRRSRSPARRAASRRRRAGSGSASGRPPTRPTPRCSPPTPRASSPPSC